MTTDTYRRWELIPGYTHHAVSDDGLVKRLAYVRTDTLGREFTLKEQLLAQRNTSGYLQVNLRKEGVNTTHFVHKLMLLAFVGPPLPGQECRHKDGNCLNNTIKNLCWGTKRDNADDRILHGSSKGVQLGRKHLTKEQVIEILDLYYMSNTTKKEIGRRFGVHHNHVYLIASGKKWAKVFDAWRKDHPALGAAMAARRE